MPAFGDPLPATAVAQWPGFKDNAAHTGFNLQETALTAANAPTLTLKWSFGTGGEVTSSPAVANGMIYVGSANDRLYAFGH